MTDRQIEQAVSAALETEACPMEIGMAVEDGVLTLCGEVDSYDQMRRMEQSTKEVYGMRAVTDGLQVNPTVEHVLRVGAMTAGEGSRAVLALFGRAGAREAGDGAGRVGSSRSVTARSPCYWIARADVLLGAPVGRLAGAVGRGDARRWRAGAGAQESAAPPAGAGPGLSPRAPAIHG
jgi:hypothetical protein